MLQIFSNFFGFLFLLFLLFRPLLLLVGAFLIWKSSGKVRLYGWLLFFLAAYYLPYSQFNWISPWYVTRGSELVQEFKFQDIPFKYLQVPALRWSEASHDLLILPSQDVVSNPKSPYSTDNLLVVDLEAQKTYLQPISEVNLNQTSTVESLPNGYIEWRDGLSLDYASSSKQGSRVEYSVVGFSLPILIYYIPWTFSDLSGWQWQKISFHWLRRIVRESVSAPAAVKLNQVVFNASMDLAGASTKWVMAGKFLIVLPNSYNASSVLVLGPFNTSQGGQSKDNNK
jgi:hypothetical protein